MTTPRRLSAVPLPAARLRRLYQWLLVVAVLGLPVALIWLLVRLTLAGW